MAARATPVSPLDMESAPGSTAGGLAVVAGDVAAGALLDPTRRRVLEQLRGDGSATSVAGALGMSRQLANYHVRALEAAGLVEEVGRRQRRGLEERLVRATATRYLLAPDALAPAHAAPPEDAGDRFSASYQVATAARTIREVAALAAGARANGKRLTTLTIDTELTFATPAAREAFANDLLAVVAELVDRHHSPEAPDGRRYRLFVGAHPTWVPPAGSPPAGEPARPPGRRTRSAKTRTRRPR